MFNPPELPLNIVIIGSGHYATGLSTLSGHTPTDKDCGVLFPSAVYLRAQGWIDRIAVCSRDGGKFGSIRSHMSSWSAKSGLDSSFEAFPSENIIDSSAYLKALDEMPRPCAALIAVPDDTHLDVMLACAQRNIPFFVVKPAVTKLSDFYRIKSAMRDGLLGMVDYHKVYDEANLLLLKDISEGTYGNIHHISSLLTQRRDMVRVYERWLRASPSINVNHYLGSHYIHMTGFLTGAEPIDVRATQQFGFIREHYGLEIADTIQTSVRWRACNGHVFCSHHIAGWTDPSESESMTYQQMHLLTENGHIFSDQRFRGTQKTLVNIGSQVPNPYFFNLSPNLLGGWNLESQYGFRSIATFVKLALLKSHAVGNIRLPTIADSEYVTAILEAADLSIASGSKIIRISRRDQALILSS